MTCQDLSWHTWRGAMYRLCFLFLWILTNNYQCSNYYWSCLCATCLFGCFNQCVVDLAIPILNFWAIYHHPRVASEIQYTFYIITTIMLEPMAILDATSHCHWSICFVGGRQGHAWVKLVLSPKHDQKLISITHTRCLNDCNVAKGSVDSSCSLFLSFAPLDLDFQAHRPKSMSTQS